MPASASRLLWRRRGSWAWRGWTLSLRAVFCCQLGQRSPLPPLGRRGLPLPAGASAPGTPTPPSGTGESLFPLFLVF